MSDDIPQPQNGDAGSGPAQPGPVDANVDLDAARGISRRRLFTLGAVGLGVAAVGGVGGWAFV